MNKSNIVSNSDLLDTRAVVVTHRYTGDTRIFYVKPDGSAVFSVHSSLGKLMKHKISTCSSGYPFINWAINVDGKSKNECMTIHRLIWCIFYNDGVYLNGSDGWEIDHIDEDITNNDPSNLQRITMGANQRKANAKRFHGKLSEAYRLLASLDAA